MTDKPFNFRVDKHNGTGWEFWFNGRGKSPSELKTRIQYATVGMGFRFRVVSETEIIEGHSFREMETQ